MAQSFFQEIQQLELPKEQPLTILGYSMGAIVAYELVKLLEDADYQCRLLLLDKAAATAKTRNDKKLTKMAKDEESLELLIKSHLGENRVQFLPNDQQRIKRLLAHSITILNTHLMQGKVKADILAIEAEKGGKKHRMKNWKPYTDGKLHQLSIYADHFEILDEQRLPKILEYTLNFIRNEDSTTIIKSKKNHDFFQFIQK